MITKNCSICGKLFSVRPSEAHLRKNCSRKCYIKSRTTRVDFICPICNKKIQVIRYRADKVKTCSKKCAAKLRFGDRENSCLYCGKSFKGSKKSKYCKKECHSKSMLNGKLVSCENCGQEIYNPIWLLKKYNHHYCSTKCANEVISKNNKSGKFVKCNSCNKKLYRPKGALRDGKNYFCSSRCMGDNLQSGSGVECDWCGKTSYRTDSQLKSINNFCSMECSIKHKRKDQIIVVCKICGKKRGISKSYFNRGLYTKYCSVECRNKDPEWIKQARENCLKGWLTLANRKGPTKLEIEGSSILESIGLKKGVDFQEQVPMFNRYIADIVMFDKKMVIEWDGDYWHNRSENIERDKKRNSIFKENGFRVIRFWEHEVYKKKLLVKNRIIKATSV